MARRFIFVFGGVYMIDLSMEAFSEEISWDNGQVEELKTDTEEEQRNEVSNNVEMNTEESKQKHST